MIRSSGEAGVDADVLDSDGYRIQAEYLSLPGAGVRLPGHPRRGTYYVLAIGYYSSGGVYAIHLERVTEPGSTLADAAPLALGRSAGGTIDPTSDADYFRIDMDEPTYVRLGATGISLSIAGELLDADGNPVAANLIHAVGFEFLYEAQDGFLLLDRSRRDPLPQGDPLTIQRRPRDGTYAIVMIQDLAYARLIDTCTSLDTTFTDQLSGCQWHLKNSGQRGGTPGEDINIEGVWSETRGGGATVAVVDGGLDHRHEDLVANIDHSRNHDYTELGDIRSRFSSHGTSMAGIVAARDNGLGVVGVAPRATIYGFNLLAVPTDKNVADSAARELATTAVSTNSWGYTRLGLKAATRLWELAVEQAITDGYGGKGVFIVRAAGNGAESGQNVNFSELRNFYGVTAVRAR